MSADTLAAKPNPFKLDAGASSFSPLLSPPLVRNLLEKTLGLSYLAQEYAGLEKTSRPDCFVRAAFQVLRLDYAIAAGKPDSVPAKGATLVVANHPFGAVEGMIMVDMLLQRRKDVRIMANSFLKRIPELSEHFLAVNPYPGHQAVQENFTAMRAAIRWLRAGGLLVIFPAGDVADFRLRQLRVAERGWDDSVARLARLSAAEVVPVYFEGRNSKTFYLAGLLHPLLKTLLLPRELINKQGRTLRLRIGKAISASRLAGLSTDEERTTYLRLRTCLLASSTVGENRSVVSRHNRAALRWEPVSEALPPDQLAAEIAALPDAACLHRNAELEVYFASAAQIPSLLQEIGRLREISFRAAGEGTGKNIDLDIHDEFYQHLFVWDRQAGTVVGAYRLGLVDEIVSRYGREGLYSYSLFRYSRKFVKEIGPAVELGRSFVRQEYQRSFMPLLLLWKGIGAFMARHPQYAVLFGPVSISDDYSYLSRQILVDYLRQHRFHERLGRQVRPRTPWRGSRTGLGGKAVQTLVADLDQLAELLSAVEPDEKGIPVLLKQYLKLGGQLLGFNIDRQFQNAVDALLRVDLRQTSPRILARYMGPQQATAFLAGHDAPAGRHCA